MRQGIARRLAPARLVLDPIDALAWARLSEGLDGANAQERFTVLGAGRRPRPLRRASYRLTARIEEARDVSLPAPLVLVTVVNPAGYELFFDYVQTRAGPRRSGLPAAHYRLRAEAPLYQPVEVAVALAGPDGARKATRVALEPAAGYPFATGAAEPPTVLAGAVRNADGTGLVLRDAAGAPRRLLLVAVQPGAGVLGQDVEGPPYTLGADGRWALLIDPHAVTFGADGKAELELRVRSPEGDDLIAIPAVRVQRGKNATFVQTRLEGAVRWPDGAPVAGASVAVDAFPGAARSGPDGEYALFLPPDLRPGLDIALTLTATRPDGVTAEVTPDPITTRTIVPVPTIVLPRP